MSWIFSVAAILQGSNPVSNYFRKLTDPTFRGLYQANTFDFAIMIPYFLVLVVLAAYGIHRYVMVYNFYQAIAITCRRCRLYPPNGPRLPYSFPSSTNAT